MNLEIVSRAEWGAARAESVTRWNPTLLDGVVVHWFGSPRGCSSHADCAAQLRSVQRIHQRGEFTDIAYNHAVCPHGVVYELRGFEVQTGANGTRDTNRSYAAVVVMIGESEQGTDPLTLAAETSLGLIVRAWLSKMGGGIVRTHGSITGSECPGPDLTKWVHQRGYEDAAPAPAPDPAPTEDESVYPWLEDFITWRIRDRGLPSLRPESVPARVPQDALDVVATVAEIFKFKGAPLLYQAWRDYRLIGADRPAAAPNSVPAEWWEAARRDHAFAEIYANQKKG